MSTANIIGNAIFGLRNKSGGNYINPAVKESLVGLWKFDQNTNESPTRNIIKNTIKDKGGDLELLNFGYKLNSGYGKYIEDFSLFTLSNRFEYSEISNTKVTITAVLDNSTGIYHSVTEEDSALYWNTFKIKVSGSTDDVYISYVTNSKNIRLYNGINTVVVPNDLSWHSFTASATNVSCNITLEFVPEYEGALVTDGKDDMIVSQKTVQEMGITNEITVVSMIHQINASNSAANASYTNYIRGNIGFVRNTVTNADKTGIYGYTWNNSTKSTINNILGDKNDYRIETGNSVSLEEKFSVEGYINNGSPTECSEVAIYWTFISNKVLTTDEINQIIGYFKLDKYVTPQVIYDVRRQGLTNDTPAADWYLKDFSGNGHDMQLYNFTKKLGSGIGKYEVDFNTWIPQSYVADSTYTSNKLHITNIKGGNAILYTKKGANAMKVKITGIQSFNLVYRYIAENDVWEALEVDRDGIYELPASTTTTKYYTGFTVPYYTGDCDITIEQISNYEGALVSDGIDDYGKVENLPIYKDYTVAIDRAWITSPVDKNQCLAFKGHTNDWGAFACEFSNAGQLRSYTFSPSYNILQSYNEKSLVYQSKYSYSGTPIVASASIDGSTLRLCLPRGDFPFYANVAIKIFLLFPYSLSEFLLERQLKRYKLGTLYPDMVEFRPIVKSNREYSSISYSVNPGEYISVDSMVTITVTLSNTSDKLIDVSCNAISDISISGDNGVYKITGKVVKSPQKIAITIDEYIRYEDIVQPYPAIINLKQDGKTITWGDKLKVGSDIVFVGSANLLPELYTVSETRYNGVTLYPNTIIKVEKSMVFDNARTYLKANEPSCILSPNRLRIPNSSYKILGYIPDLTGKGNHGKLNNFAYTEDSGVASDGSIKIDGTDDHITISNIIGGKCIMAKVTVNRNSGIIYDQRRANVPNKSWMQLNPSSVIFEQNAVSTYIDGILNHNVTGSDLVSKTVNLTCELEIGDTSGTYQPTIGSSYAVGYTTDINLYEFMLFPDVPDEEEIKELNDVMGIEGGYIESPNYYWDAYGKKNTDTDRNLIADQVSKDVANALEVKNVAYNSESGYGYGKSNFISIMESSQQFVDIIDDYNFIIKATPHNNNQFFAQVNTSKLIPNNYIRFKVSGMPEDFKMVFGYDYIEGGTNAYSHIIDKNGVYSYDSFNVFYTSFRAYKGYTDLTGLNIKVEFLDYYPNGLLLDGVEDHAINTVIPAVTDFTVIGKRNLLNHESAFATKGGNTTSTAAFVLEYGSDKFYNFAGVNTVEYPNTITVATKSSYNNNPAVSSQGVDSLGLRIGEYRNYYSKLVFYKLMLYTKTIDQLSINMLKNLFERDELIDVTNPIFKKQ